MDAMTDAGIEWIGMRCIYTLASLYSLYVWGSRVENVCYTQGSKRARLSTGITDTHEEIEKLGHTQCVY